MLTSAKEAYIFWHNASAKFPKTVKYSLGLKVENLFIDIIEAISIATFLQPSEKLSYLRRAINKVDTLKVFLQMIWEMKLLDTKSYADISEMVGDIGRSLGGWYGQVIKQNSPALAGEK